MIILKKSTIPFVKKLPKHQSSHYRNASTHPLGTDYWSLEIHGEGSGTTAIEDSAPASCKPLLTKDYGLSTLMNYQPLRFRVI